MKAKRLSILIMLTLCACSNHQNTSSLISINTINSSTPFISNTLSSTQSESSPMSSNLIIKNSDNYTSHPTSEPSFNKQLKVTNHIGDIQKVWKYYRGEGIKLAVIDSGFDINHPEFFNNNGTSKISNQSVSIYTDTYGTIHREIGRNKVCITDNDSHGTMCAGLVASSVNGTGITGIAPECELILIKVDKKATSIADAFKYCGDNNIKIASISLGAYPSKNGASSGDIIYSSGTDLSQIFNENIKYAHEKGVTIIAATGNSKTTEVSYPAGCEYVIGVGGLSYDSSTKIWDDNYEGSNYNGSIKYVDVFAPSSGIFAPGFDASQNKSTYWDGGKGTSFAAPIIAGAAALYFQKYSNASNEDFENALKATCVNISSFNNNIDMGYGRLNIDKLINIQEDIKPIEIIPTTTKKKEVTKIHFEDEAGWDLKTLHVYNLSFEKGYGLYDFERFLNYEYGRVATSNYTLESKNKCWAYSDEGWSGDYFINIGNKISGVPTNYDYYFPWWVKEATYQFVNNSNWLPKEGLTFNNNNGYLKEITNYFWYKESTDTGVSSVINNQSYFDYPAINIYINNQLKDTSIIYDYYENNNCFYDQNLTIKYTRNILTKNSYFYN